MRKVVVLTPWFPNQPGDSPGAFVANSALSVQRAGWQVSVQVVRPWVPHFGQRFANHMARGEIDGTAFALATVRSARIPVFPRRLLRPMTDILADRMIGQSLEKVACTDSADVIHAQTEEFVPIAARVARQLRLPFVVTVHGIDTHPRFLHVSYQKRRLKPALASANRVILVGEPLRQFFATYVGSERNFQVVPNGVNIPTLELDRSISERCSKRLVSVANLQEGKGLELTLLALAILEREGISNWTYQIIGEGPERTDLLALTINLGLAEKVAFVGSVRHADIYDYLQRCDVFVLPSYREAFGIAYLEAMAAGLVTVGVMGQGPSQFIKDGENGVLVPPGNVEALAAALRDILTGDQKHWREIARRGRQTVQAAYSWDNHARQLIDVYEQVISGS
jgi:glycosyltransferase involved in cell wall biosynthesis